MDKVIGRIGRKSVGANHAYVGEEARLLTDTEQRAHNARMAKAAAGKYDFSGCMVDAPAVINAVMVDGYPDTVAKRKEGMAMVRATMLAAHKRQIAKGALKDGDLAVQHRMVEVIQTSQIDKGEVFTFKIARHPAVVVASLKDARDKWDEFVRRESEMGGGGCSEVGNGGIVRQGKKIVAKISYNGRVWDTKGNEIDV